MYLEHFGLEAKPFQISADPRFLWLGEKHKEALAILKYGIFDNRGFLLLSGDVGTGKTTLINALLKNLGDETVVATVPDPGLGLMDFYNYISRGFGLNRRFDNKEAFLEAFEAFLIKNEADRKKVLLIIDESQRLTSELLEEIRLLSNIEKDYTKLLNIFFVGQNEFNDIILEQKNRPLRQRITINYNIEPLEEHEIAEYVQFRLSVAGCEEKLFDADALLEVYRYSEGYPRLINIISDHALLTAFVQGAATVSGEIVRECAGELKIQTVTRKQAPQNPPAVETYPGPVAEVERIPPMPPTAFRPARAYSRLDYWVYGVTIAMLFFIAGYLVFSAPRKFASLLGIDTGRPVQRVDVQDDTSRGPDPAAGETARTVSTAEAADVTDDAPASGSDIVEETLPESAPVARASGSPATSSPAPAASESEAAIPAEALRVYFQHNSNELTPEAYAVLEQTARILEKDPDVAVRIRGYTDASGNYGYNVKISEFRANIVKTYLVGKGIGDARASTFGMGPANPIADNETLEGRQLNRRVEIEFIR